MKRLIAWVLALCVLPTLAHAQYEGQVGYVEGNIGLAIIPTVSSKPFTISESGSTFTGKGEIESRNGFLAGAEVGVGGLGDGGLRVGISYDYTTAKASAVTLIGTLNGTPVNARFTQADLTSLGIGEFESNVQIVSANVYYNLPLIGSDTVAIRPYLGFGAGAAMIQSFPTEFQFSGAIGVRYAISPGGYIGARYRITRIQGPEGDDGIRYDPIILHTISFVLGFYIP